MDNLNQLCYEFHKRLMCHKKQRQSVRTYVNVGLRAAWIEFWITLRWCLQNSPLEIPIEMADLFVAETKTKQNKTDLIKWWV